VNNHFDKLNDAVSTRVRTKFGILLVSLFTGRSGGQCLIFKTELIDVSAPTVRIQSACLFGEAFYSEECDCREQRDCALKEIGSRKGLLVYLFQEGRGIGLRDKIRAMDLEESKGLSTVQAFAHLGFRPDLRNYDLAVEALRHEDIGNDIRLISNNPHKISALSDAGFTIVERVEPRLNLTPHAYRVLKRKQEALQQIPYRNIFVLEA
jgi:GTP cyclohydrolase II